MCMSLLDYLEEVVQELTLSVWKGLAETVWRGPAAAVPAQGHHSAHSNAEEVFGEIFKIFFFNWQFNLIKK